MNCRVPSQTLPDDRHGLWQRDALAIRTYKEIAEIFGCSERNIQQIEERAMRKLVGHPLMRRLWEELE